MKRYINLNTHSNCSMGETVITPEEIVEFAVRDGADAVALTDLNSVHGFREFAIAAEKYKDRGFKPIYGVQLYGLNQEKSTTPRKFTLLAKNQKGLKNIYKIMSLGYSKILSEDKWPCVSYKDIQDNREGVLVGLECTKSDVYQVWTDDKQDHEGEKLNHLLLEEYAIADYVGIKPWKSYAGVMGDLAGVLYPEEVDTKWLIKEISGGLKAVHKLAIATNDSNCITEQDELCFNILHDYSSDILKDMVKYLGEIFGEDKTFYVGTNGTFSYRLAEHLVDSYCRKHDEYLTPAEMNIVKERISHVYKVNGRIPSVIAIVPEENEIYDFTPVGYSDQLQMRDTDQSHYTDVLKPSTMIEYTVASMEEIKRFVEEEISDGILLIDYLQLIDRSTYNRKNSPIKKAFKIRMTEIARELNYLAKEKNIPIVMCSQLTRKLERADRRPVLHDLNTTIEIEQYVDGVIFIYRDVYYTNDGGEEAELILAKNHQGTVGTAKTRFNQDRLLYENI